MLSEARHWVSGAASEARKLVREGAELQACGWGAQGTE